VLRHRSPPVAAEADESECGEHGHLARIITRTPSVCVQSCRYIKYCPDSSALKQIAPIWRDELAADNIRDNYDHKDKERGDWEEVGDDTEVVLEVEQQGHKSTFNS
jgi:hypothetical protein